MADVLGTAKSGPIKSKIIVFKTTAKLWLILPPTSLALPPALVTAKTPKTGKPAPVSKKPKTPAQSEVPDLKPT